MKVYALLLLVILLSINQIAAADIRRDDKVSLSFFYSSELVNVQL